MEENKSEPKVTKSPFRIWIENFFYHYKWHTVFVLFIVLTVTVCTVQMCEKTTFDTYVMYAGGKDIQKTAASGEEAEYVRLMNSLASAAEDFDENGSVAISLDTVFLLTEAEIVELNNKLAAEGSDERVNNKVIAENNEIFYERMIFSQYYVCLLSEELYKVYRDKPGYAFASLEQYVEEGTTVSYYDGGADKCAVYLKSTALARLDGVKDLPQDTVIVLRALSEVSSKSEENTEHYYRAIEYIKNMLNY